MIFFSSLNFNDYCGNVSFYIYSCVTCLFMLTSAHARTCCDDNDDDDDGNNTKQKKEKKCCNFALDAQGADGKTSFTPFE